MIEPTMDIKGVQIKLLDKGFIGLVDTMPQMRIISDGFSSLDQEIVNAARVSYDELSETTKQELGLENKGVDKDKSLINYLVEHHHTSPLEQVELKFQMKAPVIVWWHHVRHRIQEMNIQSGRYTEYKDEFYLPSTLRKQDARNKQGSAEHFRDDKLEELIKNHFAASFELYKKLLDAGVAREQARIVLPGWASYHKGVFKMNLHSFYNYIVKRTPKDAQWEIRQYAIATEHIVRHLVPYTSIILWGSASYDLQKVTANELKLVELAKKNE
jgi:thymidylate synthase (FAD)